MNYREKADELFSWALKQPRATIDFENHSRDVAKVAERVAGKAGLDKDLAYAKGLLHDVYKSIERDNEILVEIKGKKVVGMTHPFKGYRLLMEKDFPEAARAALTHTFYNLDEVYSGGFDSRLLPEDLEFLKEWLSENEYDDYDLIVQIADNMASWRGIMTINDRFCDILSRHPVSNPTSALKKLYEMKDYLDGKIDGNIYELFKDEIIETAITEPTRKAFSSVGQNPGKKAK
ncbi:HD domain-containing protein [Candidatus Saccharibacteria bacterium]|nr:HD domain-containing protein [Candidatus Saccharibacteria bacterium]